MGRKRVTRKVRKTRSDGNGGTEVYFENVIEWVSDSSSSSSDGGGYSGGYSGGSSDSGSSSGGGE